MMASFIESNLQLRLQKEGDFYGEKNERKMK